jgi:outer membrane protein assembly factor BamB
MQTPAIANGRIYAPDDHGRLHVISLASGEAECTPTALGVHPSGHPLVADDQVVIPTDGSILVVPADGCNNAPRLIIDQVDSPLSPAYADSTIFSVENSYILAWDLDTLSDTVWTSPFDAQDRITTAPTVAEGVVYFGTQSGVVHAVDAETGTSLWQFEVGEPIFGGPVVASNGIFVITAQEVISIAGE